MAAVSAFFVKTTKREAGFFIEAVRRPNCQVCNCITRAIGFAKNVRMAMAFERFAVFQTSEDKRTFWFVVEITTQRFVNLIGNGDCLCDARRDSTDHRVACDGRVVLTCGIGSAMCWSKSICQPCVIYKSRTGREIPTSSLK